MRAHPAVLSSVAILLLTLSACATASSDSLADAKSLVQLVRNEAGSRLAAVTTAELEVVDDLSESCLPADEDPEGRERRWISTAIVTLAAGDGESLATTYANLIDSFSANGWTEVTYGGGGAVMLQKPESDARLEFAAVAEDEATPATISVTIASGCVLTAGAASDEVAALEEASA